MTQTKNLIDRDEVMKIIDDRISINESSFGAVNPRSPMFLIDSERYKGKVYEAERIKKEILSLPLESPGIPVSERLHKIWADYSELSGRMIGALTGISYCDIPEDLKAKILSDREEIEQKYIEKKSKYEEQIYK